MNNFEGFIAGEVVISIENSKELMQLYYTMQNLGFESVTDYNLIGLKNNIKPGYVCQYIPGQGFMFDVFANINNITDDFFQNSIKIIKLKELFARTIQKGDVA